MNQQPTLSQQAAIDIISCDTSDRESVIDKLLNMDTGSTAKGDNLNEEEVFFGIVDLAIGELNLSQPQDAITIHNEIDKKCSGEWSFFHIVDILSGRVKSKYLESLIGIINNLGEPLT